MGGCRNERSAYFCRARGNPLNSRKIENYENCVLLHVDLIRTLLSELPLICDALPRPRTNIPKSYGELENYGPVRVNLTRIYQHPAASEDSSSEFTPESGWKFPRPAPHQVSQACVTQLKIHIELTCTFWSGISPNFYAECNEKNKWLTNSLPHFRHFAFFQSGPQFLSFSNKRRKISMSTEM